MTSINTTTTIAYYDNHAQAFASSTCDVDFHETQDAFEALLAPGAHILDFGCGSGRDARHFLQHGFSVTATDGSPELCSLASRISGIIVRNELFEDLSDVSAYDGIWACSSILHLPKETLTSVLRKMARALKPQGIIYASFKYGTFEGMRNERYFSDFTEETFGSLLEPIEELKVERYWITNDVRPGRSDERWLNVILSKA